MATSDEIHFFDLRCINGEEAWSMNTWKTRFVLNYKRLPYTTEWLEWHEIRPRIRECREDGPHTVPTIGLPNGQGWVTDSRVIVDELERLYPKPSLHLQSPCLVQVEDAFFKLLSASSGVWLPELPSKVMQPGVAAEWRAHRQSVIGMTMEEFKACRGGKSAWREAHPIIKDMTDLLEENPDGPFFMGTTVSYADFVWASLLIFFEFLMGTDSLEKLLELGGNAAKHRDLLRAVQPWMRTGSRI